MDEERCAALLPKAAEGGTEALAELYEEAGRAVFAYALSILRSKPLAEDVEQDVFVKIRLGTARWEARGSACGWLLRLTRNAALDLLKKRGHELPCELPELTPPEDTGRPEEADADDRLVLRAALETLPLTERQIVLLYLVDGVPQKEIAGILRLPAAVVNGRYRAGLKKLARALKGDGFA